MKLPSGSGWELLPTCIGPAVLQRSESESEYKEAGTAGHQFLEDCSAVGRDQALGLVPDAMHARCAALDLSQLPIGAAFKSEIAFAFDVMTGQARFLGKNLQRAYPKTEETEFPITLDVAAVVDNVFIYIDFKFGRSGSTANESMQLANGCLAGARFSKCSTAKGALARIDADGLVRWDVVDFSEVELEAHAKYLYELGDRIGAAQDNPSELVLNTGPHCDGCPSFLFCPAMQGMVKVFARNFRNGEIEHADWTLDENTAGQVYVRLRLVEKALEGVKETLKLYASVKPLQLEGGGTWGQVKESHFAVADAEGAAAYLRTALGDGPAALAVQTKVTRGGIKEAVRAAPKKGTLKDAVENIETALIERGFAGFSDVYKYAEKGVPRGRKAIVDASLQRLAPDGTRPTDVSEESTNEEGVQERP